MTPRALAVILVVLSFGSALSAQGTSSTEMPTDRLRREIANLQKTSCESATSAIVRDEFTRLIETRRAQLALLIEAMDWRRTIAPPLPAQPMLV